MEANMTRTNHGPSRLRWAAFLGVALGMLAAGRGQAAVDADLRAGVYPDADAVAVGGGVLAPVGANTGWYFNPNVEVAIGDRSDLVAMSGDFHYDFASRAGTSFWVGAGPAVLMTGRDGRDRDTDLGINVLTGLGARRGDVRPFAQLRGTMSDHSQIALAGGVRF